MRGVPKTTHSAYSRAYEYGNVKADLYLRVVGQAERRSYRRKTANTSECQVTTSIKSWFPTGLDSSATLISKPIGRLEETFSNRAMDCQSLTRWGHIWGHLLVLNA